MKSSVSFVPSCKKSVFIHPWFQSVLLASLCLSVSVVQPCCPAATITGNLLDLSLSPLNTKILFYPTNTVLIAAPGLSVGPPKMLTTPSGSFSLTLDAGDYTVSLPSIPSRNPFRIAVPDSSSTYNITNLMYAPSTYIYTGPPPPSYLPLHVNTASATVLSTATDGTLLDSPCTITPNRLQSGTVLLVEAFGSFADPGVNNPTATFTLKLGSTTIYTTASQPVTSRSWHLRAMVTTRASGASASLVATLLVTTDDPTWNPFPSPTQTATVDTTTSLDVDLRASIQDFSSSETVTCDQLMVTLL